MATISSRTDFHEYCLRKLGKPVIDINVTDDQVNDRIDEALKLYWEQHYDGQNQIYYKKQITQEDIDNRYITMPENIIGAVNVFPFTGPGGRMGDIFDIQYQIALNDLYNLTTVSIVPYVMTMTHLNVLQDILVGTPPFRYNRHGNKLYIDTNWNKFNVGEYLLVEAYEVLDPEFYADVWSDRWFINYATALIKLQWGNNLSKFTGVQLPGGVMLNGPGIVQSAEQEIANLNEELRDKYAMPCMDYVG